MYVLGEYMLWMLETICYIIHSVFYVKTFLCCWTKPVSKLSNRRVGT